MLKVKNFKPQWKKLKKNMINKHLYLFYECVDIDHTCGRRLYYYGIGREYNPKFYHHWFAHGRCHWNVILPCFMLNNDKFKGQYKIITNEKHSAIYNSKNNTIYCPTLNNENDVNNHFSEGYTILELDEFIPTIGNITNKLLKLLKKHKK